MDISKYNPDAPAFGDGSQKSDDLENKEEVQETEQPKVESQVEEDSTESEEEEEKNKVPYSRFKKFHDEALELRREAEALRAERDSFRSRKEEVSEEEENLPAYWVKLYGDSEASKEAFKIQQEQNESFRAELRKEAIEAVREEQKQEELRVSENIKTIDESLEEVSSVIGRDLTEKEQSSLLDIVDEYTPKDEDGNYIGATIPFEKAWEIYELKNKVSEGPKKKAKENVANIISSQSSGEPTAEQIEKNKNWNPLNWRSFEERKKNNN
jgi:hypothetical protein